MTSLTRREALVLATSAIAISIVPVSSALADKAEADKAVAMFTGGKSAKTGRISLGLPEIAENGNTVPLTVSVESPMTKDDYVQSVMVLAEGNPNAGVVTFNFSPMSGRAEAATRMRLAKTQNITAVAKMSDGSFYSVRKTVKVTISGCGG